MNKQQLGAQEVLWFRVVPVSQTMRSDAQITREWQKYRNSQKYPYK
jgi:hypothetical protein